MAFDTEQESKEHRVKVLINEPKALAKQRLMDFAASLPIDEDEEYDREIKTWVVTRRGEPVTYTELIERARAYQEEDKYWSEGGRFEGQGVYPEFWDDYALVTGNVVNNSWGLFSCSC